MGLLGTCVCAGGRAALQVKKPQERVRKVKEAVDRLDGSKKVCFSSQPFPPPPGFLVSLYQATEQAVDIRRPFPWELPIHGPVKCPGTHTHLPVCVQSGEELAKALVVLKQALFEGG